MSRQPTKAKESSTTIRQTERSNSRFTLSVLFRPSGLKELALGAITKNFKTEFAESAERRCARKAEPLLTKSASSRCSPAKG